MESEVELTIEQIRRSRALGSYPWSHLSSPTQIEKAAERCVDVLLAGAPSTSTQSTARKVVEKIAREFEHGIDPYSEKMLDRATAIVSAELATTPVETGWRGMASAPEEIIGIDKDGNIASMVYLDRKDIWVSPDGGYGYNPVAWLPRSVLPAPPELEEETSEAKPKGE